MFILFLFFCSGATALVYEVIWSKYLGLLLGSTIQAQTVVLAAFMGGLALGNYFFGKRADLLRRPLLAYGCLELAIGLYALAFAGIYALADGLFVRCGGGLLNHPGWLLLLKGMLSVALLLVPTILMGGTLPLLAAWLEQNSTEAGRLSARFYSLNSLGAVCGAGLAGFVLVQWLGLRNTIVCTSAVNILIGLSAVAIGRNPARISAPAFAANQRSQPTEGRLPDSPRLFAYGCLLVALTGGVSMGLEVLASRCLCLILGASLQVFALVLIAFILGIALGSAVVASPRRTHWPKEATTVGLLLGASVLIGGVVFSIEDLALLYSYAQAGLTHTSTGYLFHQGIVSLFAILVMGLPAAALGSVLPLWIRDTEKAHEMGRRVGRLLTWNTLGAVGGVLVTGFVLMPGIGLRGAFAALAIVLATGALIVAIAARRRFAVAVAGGVMALLAWVSATGGEGWRYVMSSGVFRLPNGVYNQAYLEDRRKAVHLLFYEDAADATVSVESDDYRGSFTNLSLRIDGKPDASVPGDLSTQLLLGQLPLMMKPDSKDVFVLGMGSGVSAGTTLGYPIASLTVADNCSPVIKAVTLFDKWNHSLLNDPRTHVYREDARTVLKLSARKYDVIISEPSNPWMVGVGSVFSRDFYLIAASRLKPGGIMSQWFHTYELDDNILELVVRTFNSVFPNMEIWDVGEGDIVLLGSQKPWNSDVDTFRSAFKYAGPRHDLAAIGLASPAAIWARQLASQQTAYALAGPGKIQSDNFPILEYVAPRMFYIYLGRGADRFQNYDERTLQMELASPEKNKALAGLSPATLAEIFGGDAPSVNHALEDYLRAANNPHPDQSEYASLAMPCIFRGTNDAILFVPAVARTNAVAYQLFKDEAVLRTNPKDQQQAITNIQSVLRNQKTYARKKAGWSAGHFADLAAKASLLLGNIEEAKSILLLGLKLEPDSKQLAYLSRIMIHRGILKPSEIPNEMLDGVLSP